MWARPEIKIEMIEVSKKIIIRLKVFVFNFQLKFDNTSYIRVSPKIGIFYPGIDNLREKITQILIEKDYKFSVIIDCSTICGLDYTAIKGIDVLVKDLFEKNHVIILQNLDFKLQKKIDTTHPNLYFCENYEKLKEVLPTK
jgi:hypothetical protein